MNPYSRRELSNQGLVTINLNKIKKNIMLNETEKKNLRKGLFDTIKISSKNENPLSLIEDYQRKRQLSITKSGKNSETNLKTSSKNNILTKNEAIISKKKEIYDFLKTSRNNDRNKSKSIYEGSSFLSTNNNRIVGELDIIRWRYHLNKFGIVNNK